MLNPANWYSVGVSIPSRQIESLLTTPAVSRSKFLINYVKDRLATGDAVFVNLSVYCLPEQQTSQLLKKPQDFSVLGLRCRYI